MCRHRRCYGGWLFVEIGIGVVILSGCGVEQSTSSRPLPARTSTDRAVASSPTTSAPTEAVAQQGRPTTAEAEATDHASVATHAAPMPLAPGPMTAAGAELNYEARTSNLMEAAERGQISEVVLALSRGGHVNDKDASGQTALMKAAIHGHSGLAWELIVKGADVNEGDRKGQTALMLAAEQGNAQVVKVIVATRMIAQSAGLASDLARQALDSAGLKIGDGKISFGNTPLMALVDLDVRDKQGETALMKVAHNNHVTTFDALVAAGADLNARDSSGRTALMLAIIARNNDIVARCGRTPTDSVIYMKSQACSDDAGDTVVMHAVDSGKVHILRSVLALSTWFEGLGLSTVGQSATGMVNQAGQTALHRAASIDNAAIMSELLAAFPDNRSRLNVVMRKDSSGKTALDVAQMAGHQGVIDLLKTYADAVTIDESGMTPLMKAAALGEMERVKALLDRGASAVARDKSGQTALMHAASAGRGEIVQVLIAAIASEQPSAVRDHIVLKDNQGRDASALARAAGSSDLAAELAMASEIELTDENGQTLLMRAAAAGNDKSVAQLLLLGAESTAQWKDKDGQTALMLAASKNHLSVVQRLSRFGPDLRDNKGQTAVMHAAAAGNLDVVRALLARFPQQYEARNFLSLVDKHGKTAIEHANEGGHKDVAQALGMY